MFLPLVLGHSYVRTIAVRASLHAFSVRQTRDLNALDKRELQDDLAVPGADLDVALEPVHRTAKVCLHQIDGSGAGMFPSGVGIREVHSVWIVTVPSTDTWK